MVEDNGEYIDDEIYNEVQDSLSKYEDLFLIYQELLVLKIEDPNSYLVENEGIKNMQKINRELKLLNTIKVIENPVTKMDFKNKRKLQAFVKDILELGEFTKNELFKKWDKQKVTNYNSYKGYSLLDIIDHYLDFTFFKNSGIYRVIQKE